MKYVIGIFLLITTAVFATNVGDTYQQVVAEKGNPASVIDAGAIRVLKYHDAAIKFKDNVVVSITPVVATPKPVTVSPQPSPASKRDAQIASVKRAHKNAVARVQTIVNQPVTVLERTPEMKVAQYPGGWFHEGAIKPDFNNVDVRSTQETKYGQFHYVSSDLNPGVVFVGKELEFNSMTKYFYEDRSLPKKKLTEEEMLEINQLYRIIGKCEQQLSELQAP
jgi:hypothetical protein